MLLKQTAVCARSLAPFNAGKSNAARIAMTAMTTISSINVKPEDPCTGTRSDLRIEGRFIACSLFAHMNHGFYHARFRLDPIRKHLNEIVEAGLVRDPRARVDAALLDQLNDPGEIGWQRIATSQDG